jgi:hypothetical protein
MRPFTLLLALLATATVSLGAAVATTKRRFGDDDDNEVVESVAAGARHTPKDWGINGGKIYFDEISGEFKARPPPPKPSSSTEGRRTTKDEIKDDKQSAKISGGRGQQSGEDAARLNKVLKRRKKWRPALAASVTATEENEVEGGVGETDGEAEDNSGAAARGADDIGAKAGGAHLG